MSMPHLQAFGLTIQSWYTAINKPEWAPPVWMFSVAWGIIYPLMAASFSYVFWQSFVKHAWPWRIGMLFAINLVFNLIYAIGTFRAFNENQSLNDVSTYYWPGTWVVLVVLITLPFMIKLTWTRAKWVAIAQLPYLAWVSLATALQISITLSN